MCEPEVCDWCGTPIESDKVDWFTIQNDEVICNVCYKKWEEDDNFHYYTPFEYERKSEE